MNNNKVLKSKKPFFTTNKKVVMLLGFVVVVGAVLGALYGTGVIGSGSGSCDKEKLIDEILKEKEQYPNLIKKDRLLAANCEELKKFKDLTDSEKKLINNSMKLFEGSSGSNSGSDLGNCSREEFIDELMLTLYGKMNNDMYELLKPGYLKMTNKELMEQKNASGLLGKAWVGKC